MSKMSQSSVRLEQLCRLDFENLSKSRRLNGIICTVGQSSRDPTILRNMIKQGMNIVRLNMSHDSHEVHAETVATIRNIIEELSKEAGYHFTVAFAVDTKGPEIRTGKVDGNNEIELKKGDNYRLTINKDLIDKGNKEVIYVDYPNIINVVVPGDSIYLNNGAILLIVKEVAVDCVICEIKTGGMLGSKKDVSVLTDNPLDLPHVSEKDRYDIKFAIDHNIDMIFASKLRSPNAIIEIRNILGDKGRNIKVLAKIENREVLPYTDEVIDLADGVIYGREDLAVEIPIQKVILIQKSLIARCNRAGKPVILATGILSSLAQSLRPRMSEIADITNAVVDGVDCFMLAGETALGMYPLETLQALRTTCRESECVVWHRDFFNDLVGSNPAVIDASHAIAISAVDSARKCQAAAIVCLTTSGRTAHAISKYKPPCPVFAVTRCARAARQCHLYRCIVPILYSEKPKEDWIQDVDTRVQHAMLVGKKMQFVNTGDTIVIVSPWSANNGFANNVRIVYAFYEKDTFACAFKDADK